MTAQIPIPQGRGQDFAANPRCSRLGLDTWTPSPVHDWTVHTRLEVDFFIGNNSGVFGSFPLQLRYAYADFGPFRRKLTFQPAVGDDMNRLGAGVNLTGDFHPWAWLVGSNPARKENPTALERCRILGQYAIGRGINRYLQDPNGLGLDAVFDPVEGFRGLSSVGWFFCYEHWWTEKWVSNFCYGEVFTNLPERPLQVMGSSRSSLGTPVRLLQLRPPTCYAERGSQAHSGNGGRLDGPPLVDPGVDRASHPARREGRRFVGVLTGAGLVAASPARTRTLEAVP